MADDAITWGGKGALGSPLYIFGWTSTCLTETETGYNIRLVSEKKCILAFQSMEKETLFPNPV